MVSNSIYILCEFVNEDINGSESNKPVQVGFSEWLRPRKEPLNVKKIIDEQTEISVMWPINYDVRPKGKLHKYTDVEFREAVALIKAQSNEWTEIVEASKNFVQFGVPFPSRGQRKDLAKKKFSMYDVTDEQRCNKINESSTSKRSGQMEILSANRKHLPSKGKALESRSKSTVDTESSKRKCGSSKDGNSRKRQRKNKDISSESSDSSAVLSDSDSDDSMSNLTIKLLKEENMELKKELAMYKEMKYLVEEFPGITTKLKRLVKLAGNCCCKVSGSSGSTVLGEMDGTGITTGGKSTSPDNANTQETDNMTIQMSQKSSMPSTSQSGGGNKQFQQENHGQVFTESPSEEMITFGTVALKKRIVKKARHAKLSILAAELTAMVFSPEEMALCSLKGKRCNAHKNTFQKKTLDEEKVKGIIDYAAKEFGKHPSDISDEIRKSIGFKLNNYSKTEEGRKIINEFKMQS